MSIREQLIQRYREYFLRQVDREIERYRQSHPETRESRFRLWMEASDRVDRRFRKVRYLLLSLLLLLPPLLWLGVAMVESPLPQSPSPHFEVVFRFDHPTLEQLEMIQQVLAQRSGVQFSSQQGGAIQFVDPLAATADEAEKLLLLYGELFQSKGEIRGNDSAHP